MFSFIITTYNNANTLLACINSVLMQDIAEYEIIVIDDGSIDNTEKIVNCINNKEIRYYKTPNQGVSKARNLGISLATGKYLCFLDADDSYSTIFINDLIKNYDLDEGLLIFNINFNYLNKINNKNAIDISSDLKLTTNEFILEYLLKYLTNPFIGSPCNKIYQAKIIKNNSIYFRENLTFAEDFLFNLKYFGYISIFNVNHNPNYIYNLYTSDSLSKTNKIYTYWWENYKILNLELNYLIKKFNVTYELNPLAELALIDSVRKLINRNRLPINESIRGLKFLKQDYFRFYNKSTLPNDLYINVCYKLSKLISYRLSVTLLNILVKFK